MLYNPRFFIEGVECPFFDAFNLNFPGSNQLNKLTIHLTDADLDKQALFGKRVEIYLNCGTEDNTPIFRGIVKTINPSETKVTLDCLDVRCFLTGNDAKVVRVTDEDNYDGFSIAQFLKKIIDDKINTEDTFIGLDMLRDTDVVVSLTGYRNTAKPLEVITQKLDEALKDAKENNPLLYITDVEEGPIYSNIVIKKQRSVKNAAPSLVLSSHDGIISYTYKRRPIPNSVDITSGDFSTNLQLGTSVHGPIATTLNKEFDDPAEARKFAILHLRRLEQEVDEISIQASKGHYVGLEGLIEVQVNNQEIDGVHRVVSKSIKFGSSGMALQFNLNKRPVKVSEYILKA